MSGGNDFTGLSLPSQVQKGYTEALNAANFGSGATAAAPGFMQGAGGIFQQMGAMTPEQIQAGQLSNTNLDPYMNPYTDQVMDTTLRRLNEQEALQSRQIMDQSEQQGAFGGDRMALMRSTLNKNFDQTRSDAISKMYSDNFLNAQRAAQGDISTKLQADTTNQGMNANMQAGGAQGLAGLAGTAANIGQNSSGIMGNLVGQGFDMMQGINANSSALGQQLQNLQQQIIDAGKGQFAGYSNAPTSAIQSLLQGVGSLPSGVGTTTQTTPSQGKSPLGVAGQGLTLMGGK